MHRCLYPILSLLCFVIFASGCSRYQVIPDHLEGQVNQQLPFKEIRDNPEAYKGELVVVGGEVLSIDRREDKTRIEVLQLPLEDDLIPVDRRTRTQGRFIALSGGKDPLDPAVLHEGVAITLVGEILGSEKIQVGQDEKYGPVFGIKDLTIWDEPHYWGQQSSFRYGRGWGYPAGLYSGYRPFGYPYW
jgi:outer membrane lipoprotein